MLIQLPDTFPVTCHTDFVGHNSVFVAINGYATDGLIYCVRALEKGARTLVIEQGVQITEALQSEIEKQGAVVQFVTNTRKALAELSASHAGHPARHLKIIGITGTKGKTTTSFLLEHIFRTAGYKTAMLSSAKNKILDTWLPATLTTPQPDYLHQFLALSVASGVEVVIMEVAAQALSLYRVHGITFDGIIFTNFSHEHLEFYPTLEDYFAAKLLIFQSVKPGVPVIVNGDDERGTYIAESYKNCITYTLSLVERRRKGDGEYRGYYHADSLEQLAVTIETKNNYIDMVCHSLFGFYNAYNLLAATSMALAWSIDGVTICKALASFAGVPGRLESYLLPNAARCFIDYAHNPDSFHAVLSTLRKLTPHLIVLFGAGGGKDKHKRPIMGAIATDFADVIIITSDNPRFEDPGIIAESIMDGIVDEKKKKVVCQLDRKRAIEYAYSVSYPGTIIALLGKGPDEYQLVGTQKYYFSEKEIIQQLI